MRAFFYLLFFLVSANAMGTHLLGGYISYALINGRQVEVTVNLLSNAGSVHAGLGELSFGDGYSHEGMRDFSVVPLGFNVNLVSFSVRHTYAGSGIYKISYSEPNYNGGINNMKGSIGIAFYISSTLVIDPFISGNSSPVLNLFQAQRGVPGIQQRINPAPFDADHDSLSFALIVPGRDRGSRITSYSYPNDSAFYDDYLQGNAMGNGAPVYSVNAATGEILWDAPELLGEYVIAYKITQWRKSGEEWLNIGSTEVVMNDRIFDTRPMLSIEAPGSQCYEREEEIAARFSLASTGNESVTVKVFTSLPEGTVNGVPFGEKKYLEFTFSNEFALDLVLPDNSRLPPYKLFRVVVQVETEYVVQSSSWAFAIGCAGLPGDVFPDPITPEEAVSGFLVYPSPTFQNLVYARLPESLDEPRQISIIDMTGNVLYSRRGYFSEDVLRFDLSGLSAGLYLLRVDGYQQKFIVGR